MTRWSWRYQVKVFSIWAANSDGEGVEALRQIANELQEIVVGDQGGDGGEKACGGGDEGFGDAGSDGAKAGGARRAETGEGVDDAPNRAEEADEGSYAGGGGEPGHALFDAADFFGGGELHADDDGLKLFSFVGAAEVLVGVSLALQFTIAGSVDVGEGRASRDKALRIGNAFGGAEDFEELVTFAADAAEEAELLEDHRPGNQGERRRRSEDGASDPAGLRKNIKDVADEDGGEKKNWESPSGKREI